MTALVPMQHSPSVLNEIITFDGLYTDQEIAKHIEFIDSTVFDRKFSGFEFKNGRIMHKELSDQIHERLLKMAVIPLHYVDAGGIHWEYVHTAPQIYYAKYVAGQHFTVHTDTGSVYDDDRKHYSKFTLLTYLNDDYIGGETRFFDCMLEETCAIQPKKGRTLIFDIGLMHCGSPLEGSSPKYWIGTELVYRRGDCSTSRS